MKRYDNVYCEWDTLEDKGEQKVVLLVWDTTEADPEILGVYESEDMDLVRLVVEERFGVKVPSIVYH